MQQTLEFDDKSKKIHFDKHIGNEMNKGKSDAKDVDKNEISSSYQGNESDEIAELEKAVRYHNKKYFIDNDPQISDEEFDQLVEKLRKLKPDSPALYEIVGEIGDVTHPEPMLSIDKKYTYEDIKEWVKDIDDETYIVEPKYDGMAARYQNGTLATRGNGIKGEDISARLDKLNIIGHLPADPNQWTYGEVIIPLSYFDKHLSETYKNPRNAVVGIVKSKVVKSAGIKALLDGGVHFVVYDQSNSKRVSKGDLLDQNKWEEILEETIRVDYPLDGVVIKASDPKIRQKSGTTQHHNKWQIAYKMPAERKWTKVTNIKHQVGRTGRITSVAVVDPVELSGATVTNITLHNYDYAKSSGIKIGSKVEVTRSGEVIPFITAVDNRSFNENTSQANSKLNEKSNSESTTEKTNDSSYTTTSTTTSTTQPKPSSTKSNITNSTFSSHPAQNENIFPTKCPICDTKLVESGKYLECPNKKCPARLAQFYEYFFKTLQVEELGAKTIERFINEFKITQIIDFYNLKPDQIAPLDGYGQKSAQKIVTNIQNTLNKEITEYQLLQALGIKDIGPAASKWILNHYDFNELNQLKTEDLLQIKGLGEKKAQNFINQIKEKWQIIEQLNKKGLKFKKENKKDTLKGKTFAITGSFDNYSREEIISLIEQNSGEYKSSITKNIDYLITGTNPGSKITKVPPQKQINIETFVGMI